MKTDLTKTTRVRSLNHVALVGTTLLLTFLASVPAWAQSGLLVRLYPCPKDQAAVASDSLRNDFGVIAGVRIAYDERTSQLIVQAPAEVQVRVSQRLAAAFPNQQPEAEKAAASQVEVRQVPLKQLQTEQLESLLMGSLGTRLDRHAGTADRLARLSPGIVQRRGGGDLDRSGGQAGQTGRSRGGGRCRQPPGPAPRFAARRGGPECPPHALAAEPDVQLSSGRPP